MHTHAHKVIFATLALQTHWLTYVLAFLRPLLFPMPLSMWQPPCINQIWAIHLLQVCRLRFASAQRCSVSGSITPVHHFVYAILFKSLCLLRLNLIPARLFEPPVCSVSGASNAGALSCARDFMSEYDWCPVFAASNREYLCSRLVPAAVPASKRSGVLFQAVFRRPSLCLRHFVQVTLFIAPAFDAGIGFAVLGSVHYVRIPSGQRIHEIRR